MRCGLKAYSYSRCGVHRGACPISIGIVCAADWLGRGEHAFTYMCMQHTPPDRYTEKESSQVQRYLTTTNTNFMVAIELVQRIGYRIRARTAAAPNNERKLVAHCMNTIFEAIQISIHIICNIFSL